VKLKLDENLGERHAETARVRGHDVATVVGENLCSASDARLLHVAHVEGRVVVTMDKDLSNTVRFPPRDYSGIVVLRIPEPLTTRLIARSIAVFLDAASDVDLTGRLSVVDVS